MKYDLRGKVIIITGANSGIGKAASIQLAQCGATVIMACRSMERGAKALDDVRRTANSKCVELMQVDLSSQGSIHRFAEAFQMRHQYLHVLIHNAANFDQSIKKPVLTPDSVETIFATNHVGPFLLTHLLLDTLKASTPSRIVTVASKGLIFFPNLDVEFDNLNGEREFNPRHAYYQSKQAQIMFTYELAQQLRETGVTVNCVRVAFVALSDERISQLSQSEFARRLHRLKRHMAITPECVAEVYTYLAAGPVVQNISGGYWDENCHQIRSNKKSYNRETWRRLWNETERLAGLQADPLYAEIGRAD